MIRRAFARLTLALAASLSVSSLTAQSWPNTVELQLAPVRHGVGKATVTVMLADDAAAVGGRRPRDQARVRSIAPEK